MLQLDDYQINTGDLVGAGTQANVVVAQKRNDSRLYCAKVISSISQLIPANTNDIEKELKIINVMKGKYNENIVAVHYANYLKEQNYFIIIMDKCECDLQQQMKRRSIQKFPEDEAVQIMKQIFNGYTQLYSNSIIHRDIKPQNILILNGVYKIADFGIAKIYQANESILDITKIGTPAFKAPEMQQSYTWSQRDLVALSNLKYEINQNGQLKKMKCNDSSDADNKIPHKVDIFSFGLLFFYILTGELPYALEPGSLHDFWNQLAAKPFKVSQKYNISTKMSRLIERMLLHSPIERIGFEEIIKMPEFNFKLPAIVNYKKLEVPVTQPPIYVFKPNMTVMEPNKDIIDWLNQLRQLFLWKCNENPLVTDTQRNYCDALLQLTATSISNLGTPQNIEANVNRILNTQKNDIPFTLQLNLQKSFYLNLFVNLIVAMIKQGVFKWEKNKEYGDEYLKFMYILYKLANRHYDYKQLDIQPAIFKQQIMSDEQIVSRQGMKQYIDSL